MASDAVQEAELGRMRTMFGGIWTWVMSRESEAAIVGVEKEEEEEAGEGCMSKQSEVEVVVEE